MEWNQPFSKIKKQVGATQLKGEIIQLGAVKLSSEFEILGAYETNVKPVFYTKLNRHVKNITGLTSQDLKNKPEFKAAFLEFMNFCGDEFEFITWGCDDLPMLRDNMEAHGLDPEVLPKCYNLQVIFNAQVSHESRQWSLASAMEMLDIAQELEAHDALDDAMNTAKIASRLDMAKGVADYSCAGGGIACSTLITLRADGFRSVSAAFRAPDMQTAVCPFCKKDIGRGWISKRNKRTCVGTCEEHGTFKFQTVVFKHEETYSIKKKVSYASDDMIKSYNEKMLIK